jgi:hypothetical protein
MNLVALDVAEQQVPRALVRPGKTFVREALPVLAMLDRTSDYAAITEAPWA